MEIKLTDMEFRRLLDLVYIGNWVLNSARSSDRIEDYDIVESLIFAQCEKVGMRSLIDISTGTVLPSRAFECGGIHEAIDEYDDTVFFEILAEEFARRDMGFPQITSENAPELEERMDEYMAEFENNGIENVHIDIG